MSEAGSKKGSKPKTPPAAKPESKAKAADGGKKTAEAKPADGASSEAASSEAASSEAASSGGGAGAGKSARDSVGGTKDVHYGYFSSVRSPAYRSGWDAIWGGGDGVRAPRTAGNAPKPRKKPRPITLDLDLDDLPPPLRNGLIEIARAELKKSRVSYERRDKAGAVDWRIVCRVDR